MKNEEELDHCITRASYGLWLCFLTVNALSFVLITATAIYKLFR